MLFLERILILAQEYKRGILIILLAVGIIIGFIAVQRSQDPRGRAQVASGPACSAPNAITVECSLDTTELSKIPASVKWRLTAKYNDDPTILPVLVEGGTQNENYAKFVGPNGSYTCSLTIDDNPDKIDLCPEDATGEFTCFEITPTPSPPDVCKCEEGGLTCDPLILNEDYRGENQSGPGLIIIQPIVDTACFDCKELVLRDGMTMAELGRFACDEEIRLHQARGESCKSYKIEAIAVGDQSQVCDKCEFDVCCPSCQDPIVLPDPNNPDDPSCGQIFTVNCDFDIVGQTPGVCIAPGDSITIEIKHDGCVDFDDPGNPSGQRFCGKAGDRFTFPYPDGGVYDISLTCKLDSEDIVCKKRVPVACSPSTTPPSGTPSPSPSPTVTVTPTVTATPTLTTTPSVTPTGTITPTATPTPGVCPLIEVIDSVCVVNE